MVVRSYHTLSRSQPDATHNSARFGRGPWTEVHVYVRVVATRRGAGGQRRETTARWSAWISTHAPGSIGGAFMLALRKRDGRHTRAKALLRVRTRHILPDRPPALLWGLP